jgi:hypothetical protein
MKPTYEVEKIESNIDNEMETYTIEANEVMFEMLSSDIYEDKIGALIRELSTNACDSMIEAGKLNPDNPEHGLYDVHLPTILEPYFSIRDYGTGLDEEGIKNVFTYGKSNRRNSNYYSGLLGIGAKCPHAYSDEGFSVTSYFNGTYSIYYCSKNEHGIPSHMLLEKGESNEENGLEIKIAIKQYDINTFENRARKIYYWFRFKPNLNIDIDFTKEILFDHKDFIILKDYYYFNGILMGDILYRINDVNHHFPYMVKRFLERIVLKSNIGDIDIHPSREYCKLTKKTISFINEKTKNIKDTLREEKEKELYDLYLKKEKLRDIYLKYKKINHDLREISNDIYIKCEKIPRLLSYEKRLRKLYNKNDMIKYISSYKYGKKDSHVDFTKKNILVKDKDLKISNICDKYDEFILIALNLSYFENCKEKNRYVYEKIKEEAKSKLKILLRCNEEDIKFTSDIILDKKIEANEYNNNKVFNLKCIHSNEEITISKDIALTNDVLYVRCKGARSQNLLYDGDGNAYDFYCDFNKDTLIKILNMISKSKDLAKTPNVIIAHKSIISDKYLNNEKLINVLDYIKNNVNHIKLEKIDKIESFSKYLKFVNHFSYQNNDGFTSKFKKLIMKHKKFLYSLEERNDQDIISFLKTINIYNDSIFQIITLPDELLEYHKTYSHTIVAKDINNGPYYYDDEVMFFKEFWVDNQILNDSKTEDEMKNEISNS